MGDQISLKPSQLRSLTQKIDEFDWRPRDFAIRLEATGGMVTFSPHSMFQFGIFIAGEHLLTATMTPGNRVLDEKRECRNWEQIIDYFNQWLHRVRHEWEALQEPRVTENAPDWLSGSLPGDFAAFVAEAKQAQRKADEIWRMGRLLWATGDLLHSAVLDAFLAADLTAVRTAPGETFDVIVTAASGNRLLIEVTGLDGTIPKRSNKIGQLLQASQEANDGDRLVLALNGHRGTPPVERAALELITPDALRLLRQLDVIILPTPVLFTLWELSRANRDEARRKLLALFSAATGIVSAVEL